MDSKTESVMISVPQPALSGLGLDSDPIIDSFSVPYAAFVQNPGPSLSNVKLQIVIMQDRAVQRVGGLQPINCGSGSGVLPNGGFSVSGSVLASNSSSGSGMLIEGPATFQLQLLDGNGNLLAMTTDSGALQTGIIVSPGA